MNTFLIQFITVATLQFLAMASPGPDFALVTRNAILYSRRAGIYTAIGIALGSSVHISYCILALSFIATNAHWILNLLKYLGGAYLLYIGIQSWRKSKHKPSAQSASHPLQILSNLQATWQGVLCNLLNPKATLFFLGLFTLVVRTDTPAWQKWLYGIWMLTVTVIWFGGLACFVTRPRIRVILSRAQPIIVKILGVLLVLMGGSLLLSGMWT